VSGLARHHVSLAVALLSLSTSLDAVAESARPADGAQGNQNPQAATATAVDLDALRDTRDDSRVTTGMAELGVGLLTLPDAPVCATSKPGCGKGDVSLAFEGWPLFRRGRFAAGAGLMMGVTSGTNHPPYSSDQVPRDHYRRYLTMEATVRYYLPLGERLEAWGGLTGGLVIVNDLFQSQKGLTDTAVVGPRAATILTEGLTVGAGLGIAYAFAQHWRIGIAGRFSNWFLPHEPQTDPMTDAASLTGRVTAIDADVTLAYRARLVF